MSQRPRDVDPVEEEEAERLRQPFVVKRSHQVAGPLFSKVLCMPSGAQANSALQSSQPCAATLEIRVRAQFAAACGKQAATDHHERLYPADIEHANCCDLCQDHTRAQADGVLRHVPRASHLSHFSRPLDDN